MASDTDTKKTKINPQDKPRWFRLAPSRPDLPEFDALMDLYWGGPERRITGITVQIITVNAVALLILMFGIVYLGQYQNNLINARLETFEAELKLISVSLSESVITTSTQSENTPHIVLKDAERMVSQLSLISRQRIQLFNSEGRHILDSRTIKNRDDRLWAQQDKTKTGFESILILKNIAKLVLTLLPDYKTLPLYPDLQPDQSFNLPDIQNAIKEKISLSAWQTKQDHIFLSAAAPLLKNGQLGGVVLLTREGTHIENDIGRVWGDVLKIFIGTLILTIILSIYLSGVIAKPLKKLAKATEAVRKGHAKADDIPDLSHRNDEIGELSVALRQMTGALWERMDSIEQFAADVSHELKNPLTSLKSAVETASIVKKASDQEKLMAIIKHDVERLDRLLTDISNASRIDTEISREAFEKINIQILLNNLLDAYASNPLKRTDTNKNARTKQVETQNAHITLYSAPENNIIVWGVETRLAQVFQNLLSNALTFTPEKGAISVTIVATNSKVTISIEDEGPGIPENKLENIFERFYSERPEHEHYGEHSGLGLSICKQIIEAHGGQIFAENLKNKDGEIRGARFTTILNKA